MLIHITPARLQGAHHLDLMFYNPLDPASVLEVRQQQLVLIKGWVDDARKVTLKQEQGSRTATVRFASDK